ncbi:MAG TPA: hypothetical protein VJ875_25075 [Pyrinomonadaceae bacterium]|nr:hypothetical protein [Pyrinomonadaceae bacterium]
MADGVEKRQINIVDYDPAWPKKFETHAGLAAKPIVDILVVVQNSADEYAISCATTSTTDAVTSR